MTTLPTHLDPSHLPARGELAAPPPEERDLIDLPDLLRTLNRYKWGVLAIGALAALAGALYAFSSPRLYRATLTLLIEAKNNRPIQTTQEIYDPGTGTYEYYASQYEILKSRTVAERVVDKLKLADSAEFQEDQSRGGLSPGSFLKKWLPDFSAGEAQPADRAAQKRAETVEALLNHLSIAPMMGTQLVKVQYDSRSPQLAAQIANEIGNQYIESALQARLNITKQAVDWLSGKIGDIRGQLEQSEKDLQSFRSGENLVNVGGTRNLLQEQLVDNTKLLRDAQLKVTQLANSYAKVQAAGNDPARLEEVSTLLLDPVVQKASGAYLDAQEEYRKQEKRYGPKHPTMEITRGRLDSARASYYQTLNVAAQGIKAQYEIAKQNAAALAQQVAQNQSQMRSLDDKSYQMNALERNADSNRQLFESFLRQFKEANTAGTFAELNARVIDAAVPPLYAFAPKKTKITFIAGLIGLLVGIVLAALRHLLSEEIRSAEDLEAMTRLPVFGILPLITNMPRKSSPVREFIQEPRSPFAEGLRSVQTALQVSDWGRNHRHLMVTSSLADEGKSTLASCLAVGLSNNAKVLLIEVDLRRPSLARTLGLKPDSKGLVHVLSGQAGLDECVLQPPELPYGVLLAGKTVPNPAEVFSSEDFHDLVQQLAQRYDRIIFDCPPCQAGADALIISRYADGVLFVVKPDKTTRRTVRHTVRRLQLVHANLVGSVINQIDLRRHNPYYEAYDYAYE